MTPLTYYDDKFAEIPPDVLQKAMAVFDKHLSGFREDFCSTYSVEGPIDWFIKRYGHFSLGMRIRNLLRDSGVKDELFPDKNLDDVYIQMLEFWLSKRM